jgi:hypothetical protein
VGYFGFPARLYFGHDTRGMVGQAIADITVLTINSWPRIAVKPISQAFSHYDCSVFVVVEKQRAKKNPGRGGPG